MKLVFITYHYLNGYGGGVFASRAFINAFAEIVDDITLLYPMKEGASPEHISPGVKLIPVWDRRSRLAKFFALLCGRANRFRKVRQFLGDTHYDIVVFDTSMVTRKVIDFFKKQGTRVITIHHNYQYDYFRDNTDLILRIPTLYWAKKNEREAVRKTDLNLLLTGADKSVFKREYGNGKDVMEVIGTFEFERKTHQAYPDVEKPVFLITGNLGAKQTEDSLVPWLDCFFPLLKKTVPDAELILAGRTPSAFLLEKARRLGVKVIPSPSNMAPILAQAKYYICATSLGGGLKLRVMDGLSAGLPVICHQVSARGYEAFEEKGALFVYNDNDSFLSALEKAIASKMDRTEIINLYERLFSFDSGKKRLEDILKKRGLI